jgi:DNA polymerase III epsilon subunit-like protein
VFHVPRVYPTVDVFPTPSGITHGKNQYTLYSPDHQEALFEALKLRCHSQGRLGRKFLIPGKAWKPEDINLPKGINAADFSSARPPSAIKARRVVAFDCEMVGVFYGNPKERVERSELAQLCVVDVLTGDVLIDKLVRPQERVMNWRTRYSGVTYPLILEAGRTGRLLDGWKEAQAELLSYIDSDTILIGHDMHNDLHIMRLAHARVIDTTMQTAEAVWGDVNKFGRIWGLKDLAKTLLGLNIQVGKRGHDCIEDTLATREIALWCVRCPQELGAWATRMRTELKEQRVAREKKLQIEKKKREEILAVEQETQKAEAARQWLADPVPPLGFDF